MPIMLLDPADRLLDLPPQHPGPSVPAKPENREVPAERDSTTRASDLAYALAGTIVLGFLAFALAGRIVG